ncbi:hypothetical protein [Pseudomarimonas salicorniae]|uniref:Uncharacterized protein n=1 Tax=Pseudomarimonas salicorniae TaxID=2933270 RepID=A0ABT0GLN7_9GAMM|nr:hypothetical protein [Lysobacter sp. CAU 1642]MCK7595333.1 hypothetical protein [Lysobacter sp. CAU 1642]
MSKGIKIALGILLGIGALVGVVLYATADLPRVTEDFLGAVRDGDRERANALLSAGFRANTAPEVLERFLQQRGLDDFREASWGSRSISGQRGELSGTVTTHAGLVVPLTVHLVREADGWKIHGLNADTPGLRSDANAKSPPPAPDDQAARALVAETTRAFAGSVMAGSMEQLHQHGSERWRIQHSVEDLNRAFESWFKANADMRVLYDMEPVLDAGSGVDEHGVLTLKGRYPTTPNPVVFKQQYVYEGLEWRLVGLSVEV